MTPSTIRPRFPAKAFPGLLAALFFLVIPCLAAPLTTLEYSLTGQSMQVSPSVLSVPKGIAGSVGVTIPGEVPSGSYVEATLRGPSFPARRLVGAPNRPLLLPPLNLTGDYSLDGIRLVSAAGETLLEGSPSTVPVKVFDEVLVSRVTSRPLSLDEIRDRGIVIDESNFRAIEFEVGFVLDGEVFPVRFPVVAPQFRQSTEIIPAAELEERLAQLERLNQELIEGVKLPPDLETAAPNIQVQAVNFQRVRGGADDLALGIPPIPALMVIPGNVGFLNQFFSVQIFTENGAPPNSGLSVRDIRAELILPPGPDRVAGTHAAPGDDPLRFARVGEAAAVQNIVPVRGVGPDGVAGTADDVPRLQPRQTGQGEFLVEGLQEGLHVMDLKLTALLDGLAAGSVEIEGSAAGSVLVSNPKFSLAFSHPRTVRAGEPYDAFVTVLNTSPAVANLVSISLNPLNISGGILQSAERVEFGTIRPGETATASFRILSQRTGAISFSNITTSDDSLVGRFRLRVGVDERGVALNPNTLVLPEQVESLPPDLLAAANRVLGQALGASTAAQLPPGVVRVPRSFIGTTTTLTSDGSVVRSGGGSMLQQLAEAGQRVRYGEPLSRVLPDLLLDWQGGRDFAAGWDQIIRSTDAGREWREAMIRAIEDTGGNDDLVAKLLARGVDLAGRGEAWTFAAVSGGTFQGGPVTGGIRLTTSAGAADPAGGSLPKGAGYGGREGAWLAAADAGVIEWTFAEARAGVTRLAVLQTRADGTGRKLEWDLTDLPAGACAGFDSAGAGGELLVDLNCDGTPEQLLAATVGDFTEAPPAALVVRQDPFLLLGRPATSCYNPTSTDDQDVSRPIRNYANVIAVLFNKPMSQEGAGDPAAYTLDGGNRAATVQVQPGGRVALLALRRPVGALRPPNLTLGPGLTDLRGNPAAGGAVPVETRLAEGITVRGRVMRPDGSPGANLPVTLTYNDAAPSPRGCVPVDRRTAQVFSDSQGDFSFDFVISGIPFSLSSTDVTNVRDNEAIALILESSVDGEVTAERLQALGAGSATGDETANAALRRAFGVSSISQAIALAEGLDRAVVRDFPPPERIGGEGVYVLRFRGRATVTGQVLASDGVTPVAGAAVNLFPDPTSRELGRGVFADSGGRFAFFGVPVGLTSVTAVDSQRRTRTVSALIEEAGTTVELPVVLSASQQATVSLQGRVTEADGTAHDGATVMIEHRPPAGSESAGGVVALVTADSGGFYQAGSVPVSGVLRVTAVSRDGRRKGTRENVTVAASGVNVVNVTLQARATVHGRVEFANGDPVTGAIVGGGEALVFTDALGRFTLTGVPTGPNGQISAGLPADPASSDPRRQIARIGSQSLSVLAGDDNFVVVRFNPVGRIVGQVLDEAGRPVPGVNVALPLDEGTEEDSGFLWVTADQTGAFVFESVGLKTWTLSAPAPPVEDAEGKIDSALSQLRGGDLDQIVAAMQTAFGVFTGASDPFLNGQGENFNPNRWGFLKDVKIEFDGQTRVVALRFLPTARLSGVVRNGQDVPIGARVRLTGLGPRANGYPAMRIRGERDSDPALGTFVFDGQAFVGDWGLQAASPFFPVVVSESGRTTQLEPAVENILLKFPPVRETNGSLSGQVLLPDGTAAGPDVRVQISFGNDFFIRTDAQGRFATTRGVFTLPAGLYTVTALDESNGATGQSIVGVTAGQDNQVTVRLLGRAGASVLVLKADGSPANGAEVEISGGAFPRESFQALTGPDGRANFANLFEGPYAVAAALTIGSTRVAGRASLTAGQAGGETTVRLGGVATVRGRFVATDGSTPIPFANVSLSGLAVSPTGADGRFELPDVPLGTHRISATDDQTGRGGFTTVTLATNGEVREVLIVQTALGTIRGFVLASSGSAGVPNAEVQLTLDDAFAVPRVRTVTTAPDGSYSFAAVPPGGLGLRAIDPATTLRGEVRGIMPAAASTLDVNIPIQPTADLTVTVLEADGVTPHSSASVRIGIRNIDTGPDGKARFGNLRIGQAQAVLAVSTRVGQTRDFVSAVHVPAVQGAEEVLTLVMRGTGSVSGVVRAGDGITPVPGAQVVVTIPIPPGGQMNPFANLTETVIADEVGRYAFANLPVGAVKLAAFSLTQAAQASTSISTPGQNLVQDLLLSASGTVAGRIVRADGSTPAAGADVVISFTSASSAQGGIVARSDSDGRFSFAPVAVGNFTVEASFVAANGLVRFRGNLVNNGEVLETGDLVLDEEFPSVVATVPAATTEGIDTGHPVEILFSEALDPASIDSSGIFLRPASGAAMVPATLSLGTPPGETVRRLVTLQPVAPLASNTTYQIVVVDGDLVNALGAVVNRGPRDLVGRSLTSLFSATFTTRDQRAPVLLSLTPAAGAEGVDPRAVLRASFDEPLREGATFVLTGPGGPVAGTTTLGVNGMVLTFVPITELPPNGLFTASLDQVRDLAGNEMAGQPVATTFATLDTIGPDIAELRLKNAPAPVAGSPVTLEVVLAAAEPVVRVRFSADFADLGTTEPGVLERVVTLPGSGTVVYRAIASDRFGNEGPVAELPVTVSVNQPPVVTFQQLLPASGAVNSGSAFSVRVAASDDSAVVDLRAAASGAATVPLRTSTGTPLLLQGAVPAAAVPGSKVVILASAADSSGASSGERRFELAVADGTAPVVEIAAPAPNSPAAAGDFTVDVDWRDNSGATTLLVTLSGAVSGTLSRQVTGTPNAAAREAFTFDLSGVAQVGGTFTATVTATDAAGLVQTVARVFTIPDLTPPRLAGVIPAAGTANSSLWSDWIISFGEPHSARMRDPANYRLTDSANQLLPLQVSGATATSVRVRPAVPLRPGETHKLALLNGITDAAGNVLVDADGAPMPADGFGFTLTTAAITGVAPAPATRIVPGQSITAKVLFDSGVGTSDWQFRLNDGAFVPTTAIGGGREASVPLPVSATAAVLHLKGVLTGSGRPDYLHPPITLDLRPREDDDDGDGWSNGFEADRGMEPFFADPDDSDFDNDGLTNGQEKAAGTDPAKPDTDNDGLTDSQEVTLGTNPLEPDSDGDGIPDASDPFPLDFNRAPVATDDFFFVNSGESLALDIAADLLGNDSDPDGDPLVFTGFTQPGSGGTVSEPGAGSLLFTPAAGFNGGAVFQYTIRDAGNVAATATVTISVGENTRPVAGLPAGNPAKFALRFDGVDDFLQSTLNAAQNLAGVSAWTVEAWVRPAAFANRQFPTIYSQGSWRVSLGLNASSGKFDSWVNNTSQVNSTIAPTLDEWTHVALSFDGTTRRFFVNGVEAGAFAGNAVTSDGNPVRIGAAGSSSPDGRSFFQGTIDEVRVWKRALNAVEIDDSRHMTLSGREPDLAAYWPFEEGAGVTTGDGSGISAPAVLGSSPATAPEWVVSDSPVSGFRQDGVTATGTPLLVRLEGSDVDGNVLTARILGMPRSGRIFQYSAGATGAEITSAGMIVTDPQRRIVYQPNEGFTGSDVLSFLVSDGQLDSLPARLRIVVSPGLTVAADDVWDGGSGAVVTASSPMAAGSGAANAFDGTTAAAVFAGGAGAGFVHFLEWRTAGPVLIEGARLLAADDGIAGLGFRAMRLFGRADASEPFSLLATHMVPDNPYFGGSVRTEVLVNRFVGSEFRAEFDAVMAGSGPRVNELDAIGEAVVMVPSAADIVLQNATADRSQGGFPVGNLIDGNSASGGWAGDVGGTPPMTAVFELRENIGSTAETEYTFVMPQNFGSSHFVGCFRLSATTDERSQYADGLANGGDITANWTVLQVMEVSSSGGETLQILADQSVLVGGVMPATTTYTVKAKGISGTVTGFRLELLEHPSLPDNGPGRVGHGNWVLNELLVTYNGGVPVPNRAPRGVPDAVETIQGIAVAINPLANDSDPDGDPVVVASFTQPPPGEGSVAANGTMGFTYSPGPAFVGITSFTYLPADPFQAGKPVTVSVTVRPSAERRWINPAGGNWSLAANWLNNQIPGPDDIAVFDEVGTYTVNVDVNATVSQLRLGATSGIQTVNINSSRSLTVLNGGAGGIGGRLQVNAGSVTVGGELTIGNLVFGGGTLGGSGELRVTNQFNWTGGTMGGGSGRLVLAAGGAGTVSGGAGKTITNGYRLVNQGVLTASGGNINLQNGSAANATLENQGTLNLTDEIDIVWSNFNSGQPVALVNSGTLVKSGAGTTSDVSPTSVTNGGSIEIASGTLRFGRDVAHSGTLTGVAGSVLSLTGGTFTMSAGATLATDGAMQLAGGNLTLDESATFTQGVVVSSGTFTVNSTVSMPSLTFSGGAVAGDGILTVTSQFQWTGGTIGGGNGRLVLGAGCAGTVSGGAGKTITNGYRLVNQGIMTAGGSNINLQNGSAANATLENQGTLELTDEIDIVWSNFNSGQPVALVNSGTIVKNGAGTVSSFSPTSVSNTGTMAITAGTLRFPVSTAHEGALEIAAGARAEITGNTFTWGETATIETAGILSVQGGSLVVTADRQLTRIALSSGRISGSGALTVTEALEWTGGDLGGGSGRLVLGAGCAGTVSGGAGKTITNGYRLVNQGVLTASGGNINLQNGSAANATLENQGTLNITDEIDIVWSNFNSGQPVAFVNSGTLVKSGAGTVTNVSATTFTTTGTIQLVGGTLLRSGSLTQSGTITGSGTLQTNLVNEGILRPDPVPGGLTIAGTLTQGAAGRIELSLAARDAGLLHRSLAVTGAATLGGILDIQLVHPFAEEAGESFPVIGFASRTGDFTSVAGLTANKGYDFGRSFTTTALQLTVLTQGDVPAPAAPVLGPNLAAAAGVDSDGDGCCDLLEMFMGTNPAAGGTGHAGVATVMVEEGGERFVSLRYRRAVAARAWPVRVSVSGDLEEWHSNEDRPGLTETVSVEADAVDATIEWVTERLRVPVSGAKNVFLRLEVLVPPAP